MAKKHEISTDLWTTLEELLLVYAVKRHGTKDWDAIAMEVRNCMTMRNSVPSSLITAQHCRDKLEGLKRRLAPETEEEAAILSMVDELRRIRIEELRREVRRHDVSIISLESKIKRLEEEREQSLEQEADLRRTGSDGGEKMLSPVIIAEKCPAADESDDRSFNESNSTDQKAEVVAKPRDSPNDAAGERQVPVKPETKPDLGDTTNPVQTGSKPFPDWDSSSSGRAAVSAGKKQEAEEAEEDGGQRAVTGGRGPGESRELKDSLSKQSSESVSFTMKKRRRTPAVREASEKRAGEAHPAINRPPAAVRPEPLIEFLQIIRSHRLGSAFERRLRSQESERYRKLIRQHMDLRIIETRIRNGDYAQCVQKFFRDLLLCFNNAILFYRKSSAEHAAALELRKKVLKKIRDRLGGRKTPPQTAVPTKPELEQKPCHPASSHPKQSRHTVGVCGRRVSAKAASGNAKKGERTKNDEAEEKSGVAASKKKMRGDPSMATNKNGVVKKARNERLAPNGKDSRTSKKSNGETKHVYGNNELSSHDVVDMKPDRRENNPNKKKKKKQGAATFLKRMKQHSPSESDDDDKDEEANANVEEDDEERSDESESEESEESEEEKRNVVRKGGGNRNKVMTRSSSGRGGRSARQPPKRAAAAGVAAGSSSRRTRGRDCNGESGGRKAKKRSKR